MITNNTQRGDVAFVECICGSHLLRIVDDSAGHWKSISIEFFEYAGDAHRTWFDRIKLALRILVGKEAKHSCYGVELEVGQLDKLIKDLQEFQDRIDNSPRVVAFEHLTKNIAIDYTKEVESIVQDMQMRRLNSD